MILFTLHTDSSLQPLTLRTSIFRPLSDEGPSGICRACTNASVNCCTTGKINALAAPYTHTHTHRGGTFTIQYTALTSYASMSVSANKEHKCDTAVTRAAQHWLKQIHKQTILCLKLIFKCKNSQSFTNTIHSNSMSCRDRLTFSSSSIAQMRLAQVVNISTALDRVRILYTCNSEEH